MSTTTIALQFDSELSQENKNIIPTAIHRSWQAQLQTLVLADIVAGLFGARRHNIQSAGLFYTITYQLLLSPFTLHKVAASPFGGSMDDLFETPTLYEALCSSAKIWISFTPATPKPTITSPASPIVASPCFSTCSSDSSAQSFTFSESSDSDSDSDYDSVSDYESDMEFATEKQCDFSCDEDDYESDSDDEEFADLLQRVKDFTADDSITSLTDMLDPLEKEINALLELLLKTTTSVIESCEDAENTDDESEEIEGGQQAAALESTPLAASSSADEVEGTESDDDDESEAETDQQAVLLSSTTPVTDSSSNDESQEYDDAEGRQAGDNQQAEVPVSTTPPISDSSADITKPTATRSKLLYGDGSDSDSDDEDTLNNEDDDSKTEASDEEEDDDDEEDSDEEEEEEDSGPVSLGYDDNAWSNLQFGANDDSDSDSDSEVDSDDDEEDEPAPPPKPSTPTPPPAPVVFNPTPWAPVKAADKVKKPKIFVSEKRFARIGRELDVQRLFLPLPFCIAWLLQYEI